MALTGKTIIFVDPAGADAFLSAFMANYNLRLEFWKKFPEALEQEILLYSEAQKATAGEQNGFSAIENAQWCNDMDFLILHRSIARQPGLMHYIYSQIGVPTIIVDDDFDEAACVHLLEAGADDYLVRPVNSREIYARLMAIDRRVSGKKMPGYREIWHFGAWVVQPRSRQLFNLEKQEVRLSTGEFNLLLEFLRHPKKTLRREALCSKIGIEDMGPFDRRIDIQVSRLRHKIETDAKRPILIKTIRNTGYMLNADVSVQSDYNT